MSAWFNRYRWLFMILTVVLLAFAYFMTLRNKQNTGPWTWWILHATAAMSMGLIVYTLLK